MKTTASRRWPWVVLMCTACVSACSAEAGEVPAPGEWGLTQSSEDVTWRISEDGKAKLALKRSQDSVEAELWMQGTLAARLEATLHDGGAEAKLEYFSPESHTASLQHREGGDLSGEIDGRAWSTVRLEETAGSEAALKLEDGDPPPDVAGVDKIFAQLLAATADRASGPVVSQASALQQARPGTGPSPECVSCRFRCRWSALDCNAAYCQRLLILPIVGPIAYVVCELRLPQCSATLVSCNAACDTTSCRCPVNCGSVCCNDGEFCSVPSAGLCCPNGTRPCGSQCLTSPQESCLGGAYCPTNRVCNQTCCGQNQYCGDFATSTCLDITVCQSWELVCGGNCCGELQYCADSETGRCANLEPCSAQTPRRCLGGFPTVQYCRRNEEHCETRSDGTPICAL